MDPGHPNRFHCEWGGVLSKGGEHVSDVLPSRPVGDPKGFDFSRESKDRSTSSGSGKVRSKQYHKRSHVE